MAEEEALPIGVPYDKMGAWRTGATWRVAEIRPIEIVDRIALYWSISI